MPENLSYHSKISFLALGDSYTIGEGVMESDCWPVQLADTLKERGYVMDAPQIIAKTGWTTAELIAELKSINLTESFTMVSLLIGVNNQYRGASINNYRAEFKYLLQRAITYAENQPTRVIVFSIPDWGVTPFAENRDRRKIRSEIEAFNSCNKKFTLNAGAKYIDITDISRKAATDPSLLAADKLHPSGKMYQRWVNRIFPIVEPIFRDRE
jgi:lysophospholipase L1-like esterase